MIKIFFIILVFSLFLFQNKNETYKIIFNMQGLSAKNVYNFYLSDFSRKLLNSKKVKKVIIKAYNSKGIAFVECKNCLSIINLNLKNFDCFVDENYFDKYKHLILFSSDKSAYNELFNYVKEISFITSDKKNKIYGQRLKGVNVSADKDFFHKFQKTNDFKTNIFNPDTSYPKSFNNGIFPAFENREDIENLIVKIKNANFPLTGLFDLKSEFYDVYDGIISGENKIFLLLKTNSKPANKDFHYEKMKKREILYILSKEDDLIKQSKNTDTLIQNFYHGEYVIFSGFCPIAPDVYEKRNMSCVYFKKRIDKKKFSDELKKTGEFNFFFKSDKILNLKIYFNNLDLSDEKEKTVNSILEKCNLKGFLQNSKIKNTYIKVASPNAQNAGFSKEEIYDYAAVFSSGKIIGYFFENNIKTPIVLKGGNIDTDANFNIYSKTLKKFVPAGDFINLEYAFENYLIENENGNFFLEYTILFQSNIKKILSFLKLKFYFLFYDIENKIFLKN